MRTSRNNDGHANYFAEAPCFFTLTAEARQPTANVGSIPPSRASRSTTPPLNPATSIKKPAYLATWPDYDTGENLL